MPLTHTSNLPWRPRTLALCGVGLFLVALWMAIRPCRGIVHDSMIYTLFALARLYPALQHDFFVLYGTQDHYTVFSPLYAGAIRLFGLDRSAEIFVFVSQTIFFGAAWILARRITSADKALLGLGLLAILPSWYGAHMVFSHTEMFPTPRQPAEALALLGISCAISCRRRATAVCLLLSALLHPIIAGAGILFWIILEFGLPHPRTALVTGLAVIGLCSLVAVLPHSPIPHFDQAWLEDLQSRLGYLFPTLWSAQDWAWSVPGLAVLFVGAVGAENPALRRLCLAALATVFTGLALAIIGGDLLHVTVAAQMQMWRWLWLSGVLWGLLVPVIVLDVWKAGMVGRATALALIAGCLTMQPLAVFAAAALACLSAATMTGPEPPTRREQYVLLAAAVVILAVAVGLVAQDWYHLFAGLWIAPPAGAHFAARIAQFRTLAANAPLCALALILLWRAALTATRRGALLLLAFGLIACLAMAPYAWSTWTRIDYPDSVAAGFESWRRFIPEDAEVVWPDQPPAAVWYSLHRSNYWSLLQMAGMVFSRKDWEIGDRREDALESVLPYLGGTAGDAPVRDLRRIPARSLIRTICASKDVGFFASWRDLGATPYPVQVTVQPVTGKLKLLRLYHCLHDPH